MRATNGLRVATGLGTGVRASALGTRYADNNMVAWAFVEADGTLGTSFNVMASTNTAQGTYRITLGTTFPGAAIIPFAQAEVEAQPTTARDARIVSINTGEGASNFWVYINNGSFAATNNDFIVIVTGR